MFAGSRAPLCRKETPVIEMIEPEDAIRRDRVERARALIAAGIYDPDNPFVTIPAIERAMHDASFPSGAGAADLTDDAAPACLRVVK